MSFEGKINKYISIFLLTLFLLTTVLLASCNNNNVVVPPSDTETGGKHEEIIEPTDSFLLKEGRTEYKIVRPEVPSLQERQAVDDLIQFFKEATGVELEVLTDKGLTYTPDSKYISIGNTTLLEQADVDMDEDLGTDGFIIDTEGKSIFIAGDALGNGSLYGTHEFLSKTVDFEWYWNDFYTLDRGVSNIQLMDYRIVSIPDFPLRIGSNFAENNRFYRYSTLGTLMNPGAALFHNEFEYFKLYGGIEEHSEWLAVNGKQICYNANGNKESRALMLQSAYETLKETLKRHPSVHNKYISLSLPDMVATCTCKACSDIMRPVSEGGYGAPSASIVLFLNELYDKITEWFETEEGKPYARDLKILFFAYQGVVKAPDPASGLKCRPGVVPWFAPIEADFTVKFEKRLANGELDPEYVNTQFYKSMEDWSKLSDSIATWIYNTNFQNYMMPYDTFDSMQSLYKLLAERNTIFMYEQGQHGVAGPTGWTVLKAWLGAKLKWNVNADVVALTNKFFEDFYGEAADIMKDLFASTRLWIHHLRTDGNPTYGGLNSVIQFQIKTASHWPKNVLLNWLDLANEAIAKVGEGTVYADHIALERISTLYLLIELHSTSFSDQILRDFKRTFKQDCIRLGSTHIWEGGLSISYYSSWDV